MRRIRAKTWEELDRIPEGEWVEVVGGLDIQKAERRPPSRLPRVVIPLDPAVARLMKTRRGETLDARIRGRNLELVKRKRKPSTRN